MIDILEANISENTKRFWDNIGIILSKRIKGIIDILYNEIENSIKVKISIEKFNYTISMQFPCWKLYEQTELLNNILNVVRYNIYEEVFI